MGSWFKKEPAVIIGAVMAIITLLLAFFPGLLSDEQKQTIEDTLWLILPLIVGGTVAVRQSVVAPANVAAKVTDGQVVAGDASSVKTGEPVTVVPAPAPDDPFPEGH
jgi:hypothetical protein